MDTSTLETHANQTFPFKYALTILFCFIFINLGNLKTLKDTLNPNMFTLL